MGQGDQEAVNPMRVLVVHNAYQHPGGEDSVVASEVALLRERGHEVELSLRHNNEVEEQGRLSLARQAVWSSKTVMDLTAQVARRRPDVIHVHNTLPLVSPSVFWAAQRAGVPVVQTLHNFRLMCPQAMFVREGRVCEDCLGKLPWRGVVRGCYRGSVAQTAVLATAMTAHWVAGTFTHKVDRYIVLNEFCKAKFAEGGLPAARLSVKPNFVAWRMALDPSRPRRGGLYLGRLTVEKGVEGLLSALSLTGDETFQVIGEGPMEAQVASALGNRFLGFKPLEDVWSHLAEAAFMVVPSIWYEGFPRTIVEAYCCGVPVLASRLGSLAEIVEDGVTGLLFNPGDPQDLAAKLAWAQTHPDAMAKMGQAARRVYEARYAPQANAEQLESIYRQAISERLGSALGRDRGTS